MAERQRLGLDALATIMTGATPPASQPDSWGDDVDFITPSDQYDGQRTASPSRRLSQIGAERLKKRLVPSQSTNLTCIGSTIGKVTMAAAPSITNQQINTLVAKPGIADPVFLYYMVKNWSGSLKGHASGSATPIVNKSVLAGYEFEVPGLSEQRAIAEVLGALDDKIAANTKLAEALNELAETLYVKARLTADMTCLLSEIVTTQYGVTTSAHKDAGPKFLRVTDINKKPWIEWQTTPNCTVSVAELAKYRVAPGDILVARMADPGKAALVDENHPEAVFASYLVRLRAKDPASAKYIYYFLRSREYRDYADGAMQGSVQKNMNAKVIVATQIAMPSADVIERFEEEVAAIRHQITSALEENRTLAATRDALLPQLMSGKLRVRDIENTMGEMV